MANSLMSPVLLHETPPQTARFLLVVFARFTAPWLARVCPETNIPEWKSVSILKRPLPSDYAALDAVTLKALLDLTKTYPTAKMYIVEWNGGESRPASIFFLPEKELFGFDDGCPYNSYCGFMVAGDDIKISRSQLEEAQD